jgi:thioredoxin 1
MQLPSSLRPIILISSLLIISLSLSGCWPNRKASEPAPAGVDQPPLILGTGSSEPIEMTPVPSPSPATTAQYIEYSPATFVTTTNRRRVYFFHATWCPTCKQLNQELETQLSKLPKDVAIFKVDYDTESELKNRYGVTAQHTLVQVDATGLVKSQWNGGGVAEILKNLK